MRKALFLSILCVLYFPRYVKAQDENIENIKWNEDKNYAQIREIAKSENKYIFIDCYATWCGPCKSMDKQVYTSEAIINFLNKNFISIKVQMDTSLKDDENVQKWYSDARSIKNEFKVNAFPTFLFLSPEGKLVHSDYGFKNVQAFLALAKSAIDPNNQYYTLLESYKRGEKDYKAISYIAVTAKKLKQEEIANKAAEDYLNNYLYRQNAREMYNKGNINFLRSFLQSTNEKGFFIFYKHSRKVNRIMGQEGFSEHVVDYLISKFEISPLLNKADKNDMAPDWDLIRKAIAGKYKKQYVERNIIEAQLRWYSYKSDWKMLAQLNIQKIEKYGLDTANWGKYSINNMIWDVFFKHCNNLQELSKAIGWMEVLLKLEPYYVNFIDTYANLLYKVGRTREAIKYEQIAVKLDPNNVGMKEALNKMNNDEPTYLNLGAIWDRQNLKGSR